MNKRVFIIHGWGGSPGEHWAPWLTAQLRSAGYQVIEPAMPDANHPVVEAWVATLAAQVGELNEQTYFVGHSIGCQAILRYLATQDGKHAGGCVFVAGWFKLDNLEAGEDVIAEPWLVDDIDFAAVLAVTKNVAVINSSTDDYGYVAENKKLFEEKLGAQVTILENKGHFTEFDGVTELPEVLAVIQDFAGGAVGDYMSVNED